MSTSKTESRPSFRRALRAFAHLACLIPVICVLPTAAAHAQLSYSIEFQGPTIGLPDASPAMVPIGAGDVLGPAPGAATPRIRVLASSLGIVPGASGEPEVDALSFGNDPLIGCGGGNPPFLFSVDEFAVGVPGAPAVPNVTTQGAFGNQEASADIYASPALPSICAGAGFAGNSGVADGNGAAPFAAPGLNLIEPNPPTTGAQPDPGDNLDALACSTFVDRIYFSLDADWPDPLEGAAGVHSATAAANGVAPGDVLVSGGGGGFNIYASHNDLGLDDLDDLDALLLRDNGNGTFEPSQWPLDWWNGQTDMLLFSVTRNSPLVGVLDTILGLPIEEGDILTVTAGGPGIFVLAEDLGLWTFRTGGAIPPLPQPPLPPLNFGNIGDNLDALSLSVCLGQDDG